MLATSTNNFRHKVSNTILLELVCGNLACQTLIYPTPPEVVTSKSKQDPNFSCDPSLLLIQPTVKKYKLSNELHICGFLQTSSVSSPSLVSRHVLVPVLSSKYDETAKAEKILLKEYNMFLRDDNHKTIPQNKHDIIDSKASIEQNQPRKIPTTQESTSISQSQQVTSDQDISTKPSFFSLLRMSLEKENMVALCLVGKSEESGDVWFGILNVLTDDKANKALVLSLLEPGPEPIPWMPDLRTLNLRKLSDISNNQSKKIDSSPLKSYSLSTKLWTDPEQIRIDIQKVLRHAKRLPDKSIAFHKEITKIKKAAMSYGFHDILYGMATMLEKEKELLKLESNDNSQTIFYIDQVIETLRSTDDKTFEFKTEPTK